MAHKICLAGDASVGKTSLIRRFVHDEFGDKYLATLGTKVSKKSVPLPAPDGRSIDLLVWDIMGEPGVRQLLKDSYFFGAEGVLLVCDILRRSTVRHLAHWWEAIREVAGPVPTVVAANKADQRAIAEVGLEELAGRCEAEGWAYLYTSAKTGEGVENAFATLAARIGLAPQVAPV